MDRKNSKFNINIKHFIIMFILNLWIIKKLNIITNYYEYKTKNILRYLVIKQLYKH